MAERWQQLLPTCFRYNSKEKGTVEKFHVKGAELKNALCSFHTHSLTWKFIKLKNPEVQTWHQANITLASEFLPKFYLGMQSIDIHRFKGSPHFITLVLFFYSPLVTARMRPLQLPLQHSSEVTCCAAQQHRLQLQLHQLAPRSFLLCGATCQMHLDMDLVQPGEFANLQLETSTRGLIS